VPIKGGSLLVGRRDVMANHYPDVDLMMYRKLDPAISRRHLRIFREGGEHYVEDLCNNNATFINDYSNKLNHERRILRDGDRVFVSMSLALIFRVQG
jgi:pSer/pThr/pTyr-binding forkhead associated (FHA) protein